MTFDLTQSAHSGADLALSKVSHGIGSTENQAYLFIFLFEHLISKIQHFNICFYSQEFSDI